MKILVEHEELASRLQAASRVASGKGNNPALAGVQIVAEGEGVELRATNLEMGLVNPLLAGVEEEGTVLLPAKLLGDVVKSLPKERVEMSHDKVTGEVTISAGSATFTLRTLRNEDFPTLPELNDEQSVVLGVKEFSQTVSQVAPAASNDESRPILTGVLVEVDPEESVLRMVATDSYRMAVKVTPIDGVPEEAFQANVPAKTLVEVMRIAGAEGAETIKASLDSGQILFQIGDTMLSSRLIDGKFPDFRQLIPKEFNHTLNLDRKDFLEKAERIGLLASGGTPLRLKFDDNQLTLAVQSPELGEASDQMSIEWSSEELETGFNPGYLVSGLKHTEAAQIKLHLINALKPGLIEAGDDSGFQYLIMPLRLGI
jgi:DNA polymerase-3 subunit beta